MRFESKTIGNCAKETDEFNRAEGGLGYDDENRSTFGAADHECCDLGKQSLSSIKRTINFRSRLNIYDVAYGFLGCADKDSRLVQSCS